MSTPEPGGRRRRRARGSRAGFAHLIPFLLEHSRVLIVVAILSVLAAAGTLAQPLVVGQVIGRVESGAPLGMLVWVLVGLVVISSLLSGVQHFLLQRTGTAVVYSSRRRLIARILHLPIREFDARRVGDIVSRVGTDTTLLYAVLTQGLADSVGNVLIFAGAIIAMALIDPLLLLLILAVVGASIATVVILSGRIRRATHEQQEKVGELASGVERAVGSIRTVRASGADDRETAALTETAQEAYRVGVRIAAVSALVVPVAGIALQLSLLVVLGVGGFRVASGAITIASLVTFVMFLFFLIQPLGSFFGAVTSVNQALGALSRIQEILDLETESAHDAELAHAVIATVRDDEHAAAEPAAIEFRDVHFRYPAAVADARRRTASEARAILSEARADTSALEIVGEEDGEVLRGVSFRVPQGSRVALVGPSGAGKSTALTLIERFYDPTGGAVLLDGADLRTLDRADLRSRLGYVEQDAPTLAGSLADNLRLTAPDASDAECESALRRVNLGALLDRSPLGLDAPVGEAGIMLSGGERQRLAIARTLLAAPPVLLLDESTSSLDGANEQRMREAIDEVASGRTLLAIAHRLSTVVDSDLIVVLDRGRVVGSGTHAELIDSTPLYRDLASRQLLV